MHMRIRSPIKILMFTSVILTANSWSNDPKRSAQTEVSHQETKNQLAGDTEAMGPLKEPLVYQIVSRGENDQNSYILGTNTSEFLTQHPYSQFMPESFFYQQDVLSAKRTGKKPFLIAGINCDETIKNMATLTGVTMETLSLRARGSEKYGSYVDVAKNPERPEWAGVGQSHLRVSSEGFISREFTYQPGKETSEKRLKAAEAFRTRLLLDNAEVRKRGITHQQIAEPILTGIRAHILHNRSIFEYKGDKYEITVGDMGGSVDLYSKSFSEDEIRKRQSGWTGRGVQGTFLNDELFSNNVYTFKKLNAKPGEKSEFTIDGLTPQMIFRYGFYQGGPYRTEPSAIAEFFGVARDPLSPNPWKNCE